MTEHYRVTVVLEHITSRAGCDDQMEGSFELLLSHQGDIYFSRLDKVKNSLTFKKLKKVPHALQSFLLNFRS